MKNACLYTFFVFTTICCKNAIKPANAAREVKRVRVDSFPVNNLDQLVVKKPNLYLKASKEKNGEICLKYHYHMKGRDTYKECRFQYFDYSDVVFPDTCIGIINGSSFRQSNYYLVRDSILILPLIGMNNFLSIYIINLESQRVLANDIRTSLSLVWINEKTMNFLIADTPSYIDDTTYLYKVNKYKIEGTELPFVKEYSAHLSINRKDDLEANYKMARRFLN